MKNSINAGEMPSGCKNSVLHHFITVVKVRKITHGLSVWPIYY